jgi:hypothetical protein
MTHRGPRRAARHAAGCLLLAMAPLIALGLLIVAVVTA